MLWSLRKRDKRIKEMCLSGSEALWGEFGEHGCLTPITKEDLQANAKVVYQKNCAFFYIVFGYIFAIFDSEVCISVGYVALSVAALTILLLLLGQLVPNIAAKRAYPVDQKVPIEEFAPNATIYEVLDEEE